MTIRETVINNPDYKEDRAFTTQSIVSISAGSSTRSVHAALLAMERDGSLTKAGVALWRKPASNRLLRQPWRTHSNEELGIELYG